MVEEERLDTVFGLNVKGETNLPLMISGTITSEAGTASKLYVAMYHLSIVILKNGKFFESKQTCMDCRRASLNIPVNKLSMHVLLLFMYYKMYYKIFPRTQRHPPTTLHVWIVEEQA